MTQAKRRRLAAILYAIACSLAPGTNAVSAQTPAQQLIVPGVGVGAVKIGMSLADAAAVVGLPSRGQGFAGLMNWHYPDFILETVNEESLREQKIRSIYTESGALATAEGLKVGTAESAVRAALGEPTCTSGKEDKIAALAYARGISFILDPHTRNVRQIAVRATFGC